MSAISFARPARLGTVLSILLIPLALGGCDRFKKKKSSDTRDEAVEAVKTPPRRADFAAICEGKEGPDAGTEYKAGSGKVAPAVFFTRAGDDKAFYETPVDDVTAWKDSTWAAKEPEDAQLVVCATEKSRTKSDRFCNYQDGASIPQASTVVDIAVYEAKGGKKVDAYTLDVPRPSGCDWSRSGSAPSENVRPFATAIAPQVLAAYQPIDSKPPKLPSEEMWSACNGKPIPGAAAYDATKGTKNKVEWYVKDDENKAFLRRFHYVHEVENAMASDETLAPIVGCVTVVRGKKSRDCAFSGGHTLAIHDATWTYRMVEARTGKTLGESTFSGRNGGCPFTWDFSNGDVEEADGAGVGKWVGAIANPNGSGLPAPVAAQPASANRGASFGGFPPGGSLTGGGRPSSRPSSRPSRGDL